MKGIMMTAPSSGSGKTTITMGIIRALRHKGHRVSAFKTGPDYIDPAFLTRASGQSTGNLDMYLQGKQGMKKALSLAEGDICVIEGAMGYFDGIYNTFENSSYDIAKTLGAPAVLIYTPHGEMFTAIPKIKGLAEFEGSSVKGIIFNRVSRQTYEMLKEQVERYTNLTVLGFIPPAEEVALKSRHLGLVQCSEIQAIEELIEQIACLVAENVDLQVLVNMAEEVRPEPFEDGEKRNIRTAIARDRAFSFYYRENLHMLERATQVTYFSPLDDHSLPECDFLYLGGGYPEVFKEALSENTAMLDSIREFADRGGCIYAECGGLMYLTEKIEGCRMTGIFKGESKMTDRLQRFGYVKLELKEDCMLGSAGTQLTAHEFHKSVSAIEIEGQNVYQIKKAMGNRTWECGYQKEHVLGGYPHIHFLGNQDVFTYMINYIEGSSKR